MKRHVVECDICGEEVNDWYEIKMKSISLSRAGKITRHYDRVICWKCKEALAEMIRSKRKLTKM